MTDHKRLRWMVESDGRLAQALRRPSGGVDSDLIGATLIAAERRRQVEVEGWTPEHDAGHGSAALLRAAQCYEDHLGDDSWTPLWWPWDERWWKPKDHLSNLIRAGALYQAALDVSNSSHPSSPSREAVARCARKIDGILAHPVVAAAVEQARAEHHVVHVTAEPVAEDVVWCETCEEWVTSGAPDARAALADPEAGGDRG